jgi:hypothetical protein
MHNDNSLNKQSQRPNNNKQQQQQPQKSTTNKSNVTTASRPRGKKVEQVNDLIQACLNQIKQVKQNYIEN